MHSPIMTSFFDELEKIAEHQKKAGLVDGAGYLMSRVGQGIRNIGNPLKRPSQLNFFQKLLRRGAAGKKGVFSPAMRATNTAGGVTQGAGLDLMGKAHQWEDPAQKLLDLAL